MGEAFVPVDLDKLLDDFEEQDSIISSGHCSQQPSSLLNGINKKGVSSNDLLTNGSGTIFSVTSQEPPSLANGINHKGVSVNDVATNGSATSISAHSSLAVNGIDTEGISSIGLPRQNTPLAKSEVNRKDFKRDISSPADVSVADHSSLDVDLLMFDTVLDGSNVNGDINSQLNYKPKRDDHSEKNVNFESYFSESLLPENLTNDNGQFKEQPLSENVQILDLPNEDLSGNENNKDQTTDQILDGGPSSVNNGILCDSAVGTVWNDQLSDVLLHGEAVCDDRFNQQTSSSVPFPTSEETPSLFFMQDHFSNIHLREEVRDGSVFEEEESDFPLGSTNNEVNENSDAPLGNQQLTSQFIPVAQDAIAEASLPLTNNNDVSGPSGEIFQLGYNPPQWMPDGEASRCMNCHCKFTVVKRRHHCRACGKVFCSPCCNFKFNLQYLEYRLARVCQTCANALLQRQATFLSNRDPGSVSSTDESAMYMYLSPDQHEAAPDANLEQPSPADIETSPPDDQPLDYEDPEGTDNPPMSHDACSVPTLSEGGVVTPNDSSQITQFRTTTCSSSSSLSSADIPVTSTVPLPPLLRKTEEGLKIDNTPNHQEILYLLKKKKETVTFLLNKNLVVKVKIVKLDCCVKRKCWCFSSEGMGAADQEDMVILLECVPKESAIPQDVLSHFNTAFAYAKQGHRVTDLGYTIFGQPFLGSLRNAGFLYIKSSFQCLEKLILPPGPHIFGVLIQREEVSWVQLFPIRLILRLGAEYRYYPCPLWSVRDRESLYGEIGHTIMDLLADFKNFQYTLPRVTGMHVHLEDKKTVIQLPQNRYDEVVKVLNATDEYVMAFEATFSNVADSHLVCIQDGTGYKTQAINIEGQERKVTGASFIVFNGALKTTNNVKAKVSIVEDGVMVQMVMQLSQDMRQAMREMSDFTINTGCADSEGGSVQEVIIEWVSKKNPDSESILSPIDGLTLGTTTDIKINTHFDYSTPSVYRLRWTQLFFLNRTEERPRNLSPHFKQTTAEIAKSCTAALRPYLPAMVQSGKRRIGLRVNLSPDMVGYSIGLQGTTLPDELTKDLDNELVPAINNAVNPSNSEPTSMEFVFNIIEMLSWD